MLEPGPTKGDTVANWPTKTTDSGVAVVRPEGRLNLTAAPAFREQLRRLIQAGKTRLVVDLSGVSAVDSSGLGALISGLKAARQAGGDLRIAAPGPQVSAVLELTNLNRVLVVADSAAEAVDGPG